MRFGNFLFYITVLFLMLKSERLNILRHHVIVCYGSVGRLWLTNYTLLAQGNMLHLLSFICIHDFALMLTCLI